jgi:hypothetical protein
MENTITDLHIKWRRAGRHIPTLLHIFWKNTVTDFSILRSLGRNIL